MVAAQETLIVNSEQARQQAERRFKQNDRLRDGRMAMPEYEAEARAIREKSAAKSAAIGEGSPGAQRTAAVQAGRAAADTPPLVAPLTFGLGGNTADVFRKQGPGIMFTIEFFRIRESDNAHATLDRITHIASDLESAKVKAKSLFETLNLPQDPMACAFWTRTAMRCSFGRRRLTIVKVAQGAKRRLLNPCHVRGFFFKARRTRRSAERRGHFRRALSLIHFSGACAGESR